MEKNLKIYNLYYEWWKNIDKLIFSLIVLLFIIGLFFSLVSTSLIASDKLNTNDYSFFFKHLIFIFLGVIVIFTFSSINQKRLFKMTHSIDNRETFKMTHDSRSFVSFDKSQYTH